MPRFICDIYTNDGTCFPAVNQKLVHQLRIHHSGLGRSLFTSYMIHDTILLKLFLGICLSMTEMQGERVSHVAEDSKKGIASCFNIRQIVTFFIIVSLDGKLREVLYM